MYSVLTILRVWTEIIERNLNLLSSSCLSERVDYGFVQIGRAHV